MTEEQSTTNLFFFGCLSNIYPISMVAFSSIFFCLGDHTIHLDMPILTYSHMNLLKESRRSDAFPWALKLSALVFQNKMPHWIVPTLVSRICIIHQRYRCIKLMRWHDFQHLPCPLIRSADKLNTLAKKQYKALFKMSFFFFPPHVDALLYWLKCVILQSLNVFCRTQSSGMFRIFPTLSGSFAL